MTPKRFITDWILIARTREGRVDIYLERKERVGMMLGQSMSGTRLSMFPCWTSTAQETLVFPPLEDVPGK